MSVWLDSNAAVLHGAEGDLLSVKITIEAFWLEELLDSISAASFPINPEIVHHPSRPEVSVEFPAWRSQIGELERLMAARHFDAAVTVTAMLEEIQTV